MHIGGGPGSHRVGLAEARICRQTARRVNGRNIRRSAGTNRLSSLGDLAETDFFREQAKQSVARAVRDVEALTAAELVVAVRRRSGDYGVAGYHFGFTLAAAVVLYLLFAPQVFTPGAIALDGVLAFLFGVLCARNVSPLLRLFVRDGKLQKNVGEAARVVFFDQGISRTSGRTGVLVFVSTFERCAVVLTDVGIDTAALGPAWQGACEALSSAVKRRDLVAFEAACRSLGPILAAHVPSSKSDVNELPDELC